MLHLSGMPRRLHPIMALVAAPLVACLTSYPGRVPGDTKLSLYLDPLRLISDSIWTWDQRSFAGWVPHQNVGYLWPSGPFFGFFDLIGSPDWIAHRFWIATLMAVAGVGAFRLARHLGFSTSAAVLTGLAYEFSPYVLPYISRTSALLLPWSLLPWIILLAIRYARTRHLRDLALFGFVIASSGGLNATALLMIAPAPLIWLIHLWMNARVTRRQFMRATVHLALVATAMSAWWLSGLFVQGRYGAAVLSYSEALVSTSTTSSAPEVLRGLGYWLFYDRGTAAPLTSASTPYQESIPLLVVSGAMVVLSLWGISKGARWRRPVAAMLLTGVVLAVGAHPFSEPNVLFRTLADNPKDSLSLALRSSTRAIPLVVLSLALGLGALWQTRQHSPSSRRRFTDTASYGLFLILIFANLPAATNGDLVDRALLRPERLPEAWIEAGRFLDERFDAGHTGSVLLVPGIESAAYRWGYPVDQILPAISRKPLLTREWLPLGSPAVMDLLYALDDSFQNGTADPDSIAPVARMLGADTVMFVSSHQFERFGTIRPSRAFDVFEPVPEGLEILSTFGQSVINTIPNDDDLPSLWSEEFIGHPDRPLPEIVLYAVEDPSSPARQFDDAVLLSTDGTGLVDLAANGLLTGHELTFSASSLESSSVQEISRSTSRHILTDSHRRRAHHWRSSQDVWGATEPLVGVLSVQDDFDSRLPIDGADIESQTIIEEADVEAVATAYGPELRYHPEFRPRMAVDGDPSTAWRIGPDRSAIGHILTITSHRPLPALQLLQPLEPRSHRITSVSIRAESGPWIEQTLDESSRTANGTLIELSSPARRIDIRIDSVDDDGSNAFLGVGFVEVVPRSWTSPEIVRLPDRLVSDESVPLEYSLTRLRSDPFDRTREDSEQSIIRRLPHPATLTDGFSAEVRLSPRASDEVLMRALGIESVKSSGRLHGSAGWWGAAAFDDNPATAWRISVSAEARNRTFEEITIPLSQSMQWIELDQIVGIETSTATSIALTFTNAGEAVASQSIDFEVDALGRSGRIEVSRVDADAVTVRFQQIEPTVVRDPYSQREAPASLAISEIRSDAWTNSPLPAFFDNGCRDDLIELDGLPVPIRLSGSVADALSGKPITATLCSSAAIDVTSGSLLAVEPGSSTGWDVDRMAFGRADTNTQSVDAPSSHTIPLDIDSSRASFVADTSTCTGPCWIEMPFGHSTGWQGSLDGRLLDPPVRSAAGRAVWSVDSSAIERRLETKWTPQRFMWWGLGISATTLIALFALALREIAVARRRGDDRTSADESLERVAWWSNRRTTATGTSTSALLGTLLGVLIVSPQWGLAIGLSLLVLRRLPLLGLSIGAVALGYVYVAVQQTRFGPSAGFMWPTLYERAHRPMLAVLVVFTVLLHGTTTAPARRRISFAELNRRPAVRWGESPTTSAE